MSQVLGKPQLEDEDDDEEDELVGLADYGDGPDSSDADPDSGTEEGGERRVPCPAPRPVRPEPAPGPFSLSSGPPRGQTRWPTDLGADSEERSCGVGVGRGARERPQAAKWGIPGAGGDGGTGIGEESRERKHLGGRNKRSLAPSRAGTSPTAPPSSQQGLGVGEGRRPPGSPWDLSLNAAVEAGVRCRG